MQEGQGTTKSAIFQGFWRFQTVFIEWSDLFNGQRKRAKTRQEHENEFFQSTLQPGAPQPGGGSDQILQMVPR